MTLENNIVWLDRDQKPPEYQIPWLSYLDFLTLKLQTEAGDACLQVLNQQWGPCNSWDKDCLNIADERVMHREILMSAFDVPCWYARTILPHTTYQASMALFDRLQHESLGQLIFNSGVVARQTMMVYPIHPQSIEYHWVPEHISANATVLWGRLATFIVEKQHPFYLLEIILPGIQGVTL